MHYCCFLWESYISSAQKSYARDVLQQKCWHLFDASSFTISIWIWSSFCWIWIDFFFRHNHFSVLSCWCWCSAACVCLVKPSTICHRCEHEYFDYYCDYFVWCVLGTKIQMESHIIDLTHRCVNSRCNVTHFKWCVCACFFLFFVMLIIALCSWNCVGCSTTNDMFSLRHLVWLIGGSNKILKPEQKKLPSNETCRLLVAFHFLSFQKGMIFESESKKGLKSIFFIHRLYCVPQLSNWFIWTMNIWKKNANTRMTSNMCQNTHCRRLLGVFVKPLKL